MAAVTMPSSRFYLLCPECHEPLARRRRGMSLAYACHTGHSFKPSEVLFAGLGGAEAALPSGARRTVEDVEERLRGLALVARPADEQDLDRASPGEGTPWCG